MAVLFWCEFPEGAEWGRLDHLLGEHNLQVSAYVAATSRRDFLRKKKAIGKFKSIKVIGAWPVLPKERGYWFSGFLEKEDIDLLDEFKGIDLKIDIEPPIPKSADGFCKMSLWLLRYMLKKQKNKKYFQDKVRRLSEHGNVIVSTIPFPQFMLRRYGFYFDERLHYSYMFYSSLIPKWLRWLYKGYYLFFASRRLKRNKETYFALGLIAKGVYLNINNKETYQNPEELVNDASFLKRVGIKNFVIFRLEGILERENPEEWIEAIKRI